MRLLYSLVFLISPGKNHSVAFMSSAFEWKKDHRRDSLWRITICILFALPAECGFSGPGPAPDALCCYPPDPGGKLFQFGVC